MKNSYHISIVYGDLGKDFTEELIHTQFILKKLNFFLDNKWQGEYLENHWLNVQSNNMLFVQ